MELLKMNIYTKKGKKVIYCNPDNGYLHNQKDCQKHLIFNQVYTVDHTEVGSCHTDVYLKEIPDVPFNSVMFENV